MIKNKLSKMMRIATRGLMIVSILSLLYAPAECYISKQKALSADLQEYYTSTGKEPPSGSIFSLSTMVDCTYNFVDALPLEIINSFYRGYLFVESAKSNVSDEEFEVALESIYPIIGDAYHFVEHKEYFSIPGYLNTSFYYDVCNMLMQVDFYEASENISTFVELYNEFLEQENLSYQDIYLKRDEMLCDLLGLDYDVNKLSRIRSLYFLYVDFVHVLNIAGIISIILIIFKFMIKRRKEKCGK